MAHQPEDRKEREKSAHETDEREEGLASLLGVFNDDPAWREIQEHIEEYRRQMDELNKY